MEKDKLILVTNDDGIDAPGVKNLVKWLLKYGRVVCVCPDGGRSGQSMAITVNSALRVNRLEDYEGAQMYKVNGTPVDCVKLAMARVLKEKPDLVVSGINHGSNAAINVIYSGTMGAVFEGCAFGIPSVGFSYTSHNIYADLSPCKPVIDFVVRQTLTYGLPNELCLNVNIPAHFEKVGSIRVTKACKGNWTDEYEEYVDPSGRPFYWLKGYFINLEPDNEDTDEWCLAHGIASIVPTHLDRTTTNLSHFDELKKIYEKEI